MGDSQAHCQDPIVITLEVRDTKPSDFQVILEDRVLLVRNKRKHSVIYSWSVPKWTDAESIAVTLKDNILTITISRSTRSFEKAIPVIG